MNTEQINKVIGDPCPLGHHVYGMWSLTLKIVLILLLITIPINFMSILIISHNFYHTEVTVEKNRQDHVDTLNQLDRLVRITSSLQSKNNAK